MYTLTRDQGYCSTWIWSNYKRNKDKINHKRNREKHNLISMLK